MTVESNTMQRGRAAGLAVAFVLCGCGHVTPVEGTDAEPNASPDAGADTPDAGEDTSDAGITCQPDSSTCSEGIETVCTADGEAQTRTCAVGCNDDGTLCADIVPSNDMGTFLEAAESGPDLELPDGTVIDTAQGVVLVNDDVVDVPNELLDAPLFGVDVRVFSVHSLTVTGKVTIEGGPGVAFVSHGEIAIQGGHLSADARGSEDGPGFGPDGHGTEASCSPGSCGGDGGGGFGGRGGRGGDGDGGVKSGAEGGQIVGNEELVPLRGGGNGTNSGGGGGGAIQLVSRTSITVTSGGAVSANGGGYDFNQLGGGGAGGGVLLEAPAVVISGDGSALAANGGGGGCIDIAETAEDGRLDDQRAAGCRTAASGNGDGGDGGSKSISNFGIAGEPGDVYGGGGGGGVGRIRVNTESGEFTITGGAIVSPVASTGTLPIR